MDAVFYGLAATGAVLLLWYYIVWYRAERPKSGTLEWIDRWERPRFALSSCGKALKWQDALWALLPAAVAAIASLLLKLYEPLYTGSLGVLLCFEIGEWTLYLSGETICAALAAAAAYVLGKALTGKTVAGLAGALLYAVRPLDEAPSCLLFGGLLLFWLWAAYPRRGFVNWLLPLGGSLLAGAATFSYYLYGTAAAFLIALPVLLIHRVRADGFGGWQALLLGAASLCAAAVGFAVTSAAIGGVPLFSSGYLSWLEEFFRREWEIVSDWMFSLPILQRLPAAPMLLSGLVPLILLRHGSRDGGALFLLLWAAPIALQYVLAPALFPLTTAALICAYLTGRLIEREHPVAAGFGAVGAIAVLALQDVILDFLSVSYYF